MTFCALLLAAAVMLSCQARRSITPELTIALAVFPGEAEKYRDFVKAFERGAGVRVNLIAQGYGDILRALQAESAAGRGKLDLVELDLAMLGEARDSVRNLDRIVTTPARRIFPEAAWRAATFDGQIRFVPHRLMWQAMIFNRLEVPQPPATWEQLESFARQHPGKLALKAARYEGAICDVMPLVWGAAGDEEAPGAAGAIRAFELLHSLSPYLNEESAVFREMSVLEAQARGEVWIHFNWPFAMSYLSAKGLAPSVNLSAPIPRGPVGSATPLGGGYLAIPNSAPNPQLAEAFLRYLLAVETQRALSRALGWYGGVEPEAGSEQSRLFAGFSAMRPFVRARPATECYGQLSNRWQRAIREVLFGGEEPQAAIASSFGDATTRAGWVADKRRCSCR